MDLLRHLRLFVAVAEEGHFGRAAVRLEMTQPPVSQGLRRLERELGVPLLRRTSHGAELTVAGRELLPRARILVDDADRFRAEARRLRSDADLVTWAVSSQVDTAIAAACARRLRSTGVSARMTRGRSTTVVGEINSGAIDFAVIDHPCVIGDLTGSQVVSIQRVLAVPAGHSVATADRPAVRHLADLQLCHPPRVANPAAYDELLGALDGRGLSAQTLSVSDDGEAIAAVAAGYAWSLAITPAALAHIDAVRCVRLAADAVVLRLRVISRGGVAPELVNAVMSALWAESKRRA